MAIDSPPISSSKSSRLPVVLLTGASSGLGAAMAARYSQWATVYGTTRSNSALSSCRTLHMDVTKDDSVLAAVEQVLEVEGRVDVLINNAGAMLVGASETVPISNVIRQFEVNCFGAMRVTQAVLPSMRLQRQGIILNIGSMAGSIPLPYRSHYASSKAALEVWAWSLRLEVQPFGIGVACVQAGDFRSELSAHGKTNFNQAEQEPGVVSDYSDADRQAQASYESDETSGPAADRIAEQIEPIVRQQPRKLRFHYTAGSASQRWQFALKWLLSDRALEAIMRQKITPPSNSSLHAAE